jgi:hypothetical protein
MDIQAIIDKVLPIFEAHKNEGDIEVEIRLGKHNGSLFDTNVGKDTWKRVLKGLKKYNGWESVKMSTSDVYYTLKRKTQCVNVKKNQYEYSSHHRQSSPHL